MIPFSKVRSGLFVGIALAASLTIAPRAGGHPLTVADAIETTDLAGDRNGPICVSPDGKRYVTRLVRGDVVRNEAIVSLLMGHLDSFDAAAPVVIKELATSGLEMPAGHRYVLKPSANPLRWLDAQHVGFLWEDIHNVQQVVSVDVDSGTLRYLTAHRTDVVDFSIGPVGNVAYIAKAPASVPPSVDPHQGRIVGAVDAIALARGEVEDGSTTRAHKSHEAFAVTADPSSPLHLGVDLRNDDTFGLQISPDGRHALVLAWPAHRPAVWNSYLASPRAAGDFRFRVLADAMKDTTGWSANARKLTQVFIVDLVNGNARPLWDAPVLDRINTIAVWAPDGDSILFGPALMPNTSPDLPRVDVEIAEIDIRTGRHRLVPLPSDIQPDPARPWPAGRVVDSLSWTSPSQIEIRLAGQTLRYLRSEETWRLVAGEPTRPPVPAALVVEVGETLNDPPVLRLLETATGRSRLLFDPNPALRANRELARVETFEWTLSQGKTLRGLLYLPPDSIPGRRYPLVLHVGGSMAVRERFSLYGMPAAPGLGPSWSVYAAQPLASRGMATLIIPRVPGTSFGPGEAAATTLACETAVRALDQRGLIDPARVGLTGFSRAGWHVLRTLTHSELPFAAAIVSDSIDGSYLQATFVPGAVDGEGGGPPFGAGLESWLENSPGFNVDRMRAPLRLVSESSGGAELLYQWETFARLRSLRLPVEYYLIPDVEHGSHNLQNPGQILALKQGTVDWFDFWLNDREDPAPAKIGQYERWRELRRLHETSQKTSRRPLLDWTVKPVGEP